MAIYGASRPMHARAVEAFSMRMLAERLESGTATLFRHVAGKDEILAYVIDRVLGEHETSWS